MPRSEILPLPVFTDNINTVLIGGSVCDMYVNRLRIEVCPDIYRRQYIDGIRYRWLALDISPPYDVIFIIGNDIGIAHNLPNFPTDAPVFYTEKEYRGDGCIYLGESPDAVAAYAAADYNASGVPSVQDLFAMLEDYFAGVTTADVNKNGTLSVQDIFDFLAIYLR